MKSRRMTRRQFLKNAGIIAGGAFGSSVLFAGGCSSGESTQSGLMTVLNPEGQPPPILLTPMAERLDNLDGKNIYIVDIHFTGTQVFLEELQKAVQDKYPKANILLRLKAGAYAENDAALWDEIEQNGDGVLMGVGH
jgi:hypothetical protein